MHSGRSGTSGEGWYSTPYILLAREYIPLDTWSTLTVREGCGMTQTSHIWAEPRDAAESEYIYTLTRGHVLGNAQGD